MQTILLFLGVLLLSIIVIRLVLGALFINYKRYSINKPKFFHLLLTLPEIFLYIYLIVYVIKQLI